MRAFFVGFVPGRTEREIADAFEARFGARLTEGQIGSAKARFGVKSGTHGGRFAKGAEPWNKGLPQSEWGMGEEAAAATRRTRFRPGNVPHNVRPMGSERLDGDGYTLVKTREGAASNYRMKHVVEYERLHGAVPEGCIVMFANGDRGDFSPENLVAVPRRLSPAINRMRAPDGCREELEAVAGIAALDSAARAAELSAERECGACGRAFRPDRENQRTCRGCLDRGVRAGRRARWART